jgi:hypothetical protein
MNAADEQYKKILISKSDGKIIRGELVVYGRIILQRILKLRNEGLEWT